MSTDLATRIVTSAKTMTHLGREEVELRIRRKRGSQDFVKYEKRCRSMERKLPELRKGKCRTQLRPGKQTSLVRI